jgi:hypothetical protein
VTSWSDDELAAIGNAEELHISTRRADGSWSGYTPIWVVRVGDALFIRSYRGPNGAWYQRARRAGAAIIRAEGIQRSVSLGVAPEADTAALDAGYRTKYGRYGANHVGPMTQPDAQATTLRLIPD